MPGNYQDGEEIMARRIDEVTSGLEKVLGVEPQKSAKRRPPGKARSGQNVKEGTKKKPGAAPEGKTKVTYYIASDLKKRVDYAAVDLGKKASHLVEIALREWLKRHELKHKA
jgi:hypothetical protein